MATTTSAPVEAAAAPDRAGGTRPADVFVPFGITGDPAKVMTYAKGSWGPDAADGRIAGHGRWHEPWVGS